MQAQLDEVREDLDSEKQTRAKHERQKRDLAEVRCTCSTMCITGILAFTREPWHIQR